MARPLAALDTDIKQCLVDFFDDPNDMRWHARLLLVPSGARDGRWIAASPDYDLAILNLSEHRVIPLTRLGRIPPDKEHESYLFDPPLPGELEDLTRQARDMASLVGFGAAAVGGPDFGRWRLADTSLVTFGEVVPDAALSDDDLVVLRGSRGLVRIGEAWVFMERILVEELAAWREAKASGGGADRRVLPMARDSRGRRFRSEVDSLSLWRSEKETDFPLPGPRVAAEFFESLRGSGQTLQQHHLDWVRKSSAGDRTAVTREHFALSEMLRVMITHDQLDVSMLAGADLMVRRLLVIEMAVARNPRAPDWDGLEVAFSMRTTETGGAHAHTFETWLSNVQKDHAQVLKQGRLLREERATRDKKTKGKKGDRGAPEEQ